MCGGHYRCTYWHTDRRKIQRGACNGTWVWQTDTKLYIQRKDRRTDRQTHRHVWGQSAHECNRQTDTQLYIGYNDIRAQKTDRQSVNSLYVSVHHVMCMSVYVRLSVYHIHVHYNQYIIHVYLSDRHIGYYTSFVGIATEVVTWVDSRMSSKFYKIALVVTNVSVS